MAVPSAPDYDNQRYGGPDGIRYPAEAGKATFALKQEIDINVGGAGTTNTVNLTSLQVDGSYYTVTNAGSGATTVNFPVGAAVGHVFAVYNNSGEACTFKVSGQTGVSVANSKKAILVVDKVAGDILRVTADT
jgi:hypothetical protein